MTTLDGTVDLARDRELVERCQEGDEQAFAELYQRYQRRLHRFCVRRLHASDDAEEAVQEAFARAWRALPRFAGERRFYPWLTVIAGNVCTDMLRRRSRTVPMGDVPARDVDAGAPEIDEQLLRQVDLALASEALGNLSDRHQRVLRLREGTEWSAQRIAEHEGLAAPAVDTLLWRARQAFKREFVALSETGGGLAAVLGLGLASLRRGIGRVGARVASVVGPVANLPRGPGALAATVAVAGAAIAGGSVALVGQGPAHGAPPSITTTVSSPTAVTTTRGAHSGSGAPTSTRAGTGSPTGTAGNASATTTRTTALAPASPIAGANPRALDASTGAPALGTVLGELGSLGGLLPSAHDRTPSIAAPAVGTVGGVVSGTVSGTTGAVGAIVTTATSALTTATSALTTATSVVGTVLQTSTGTTGIGTTGSTTPSSGSGSGSGSATGGASTGGNLLTVPGLLGG